MKRNSEQQAKVRAAVAQIVELFASGQLPEAVARTWIQRAAGDERPCDRWSLGNRLLMMLAGTEDARGFRQWQAVGRRVRRGARAFYILAPLYTVRRVRETVTETDPETGAEVERVVETERQVLIGFRGVPVFRVEDTEPIPGREHEYQPVDYTPAELPPLYDVAQRAGLRVEWRPGNGDAWGYYSPSEGRIVLHTYDVKTFFHELAHAFHGRIQPLRPGQDPRQEIIAETVALALCRLYGYEGWEPHAYKYIEAYCGDDPAKAVMSVLATVEKVLNLILDNTTTLQKQDDAA